MGKKIKKILVFLIGFSMLAPGLYAENVLNGRIESIQPAEGGAFEIMVKTDAGRQAYRVSESTLVESSVPVSQVKAGQRIFLGSRKAGGAGGGGKKGWKAPMANMSKSMKRRIGMPDIPSIPEIPAGAGSGTDIPKIPKAPKIPGVQKGPRGEPTEEEQQQLYGKAEQKKAIAKDANAVKPATKVPAPAAPEPITAASEGPAKKVLRVENTKRGIQLQLLNEAGKKEVITLAPNKKVIRNLAVTDLRENMTVDIETEGDAQGAARRITVVL